MTMSRELQALIAERNETPKLVGTQNVSHDAAELYRFGDNTEVIVTNAGLVTEDTEGFAELRIEILGLLAYAESEIKRLKLGDSPTNCHGVAAYAVDGGVRLSDGVGLDVVCADKDAIDTELEEMASFYAESEE